MRDQTRRDETTLQISTVLVVFALALGVGGAALFVAHLAGVPGGVLESGLWVVFVGATVVAGVVGWRAGRS